MAGGRAGGRSSRSFSSSRRRFNLDKHSPQGIEEGARASQSLEFGNVLGRMSPEEKCDAFLYSYIQSIIKIGKDSCWAVLCKEELANCSEKHHEEIRRFDNSKAAREARSVEENEAAFKKSSFLEEMSLKDRCKTLKRIYDEAVYILGPDSCYAAHLKSLIGETCTGVHCLEQDKQKGGERKAHQTSSLVVNKKKKKKKKVVSTLTNSKCSETGTPFGELHNFGKEK